MRKSITAFSSLILALVLFGLINTDSALCSVSQAPIYDEPTLQEWFTQNGYAVNVTADETSIETFSPGYYKVTILAEIAAYASMNNLSWYPSSSGKLSTILQGENVTGDTLSFMADEVFGLCLGSPDGLFYTESLRNQDDKDHALVFANPIATGFIIAWEDLWNQGDEDFQDTILAALTPINVDVRYYPKILNLKSKGRWITAFIRLPKEYKARDVDIASIMLNRTVLADPRHYVIIDCRDLHLVIIKFSRTEVIKLIENSVEEESCQKIFTEVVLTITGALGNGTPFQGTSTIRAIHLSRCSTRYSFHFSSLCV